ncbi:transcriptional regulator, LacI family [Thermanaeromonas toyohensis ToBE]|uniref:Transcriptional regulator, LacI family n=1 Tax=Thermanaeromonas toyohensis ToBE TaxID=698762 RepID=A0A1W1VWU2_9FIRM|nr:LacI family DNA-binding transcriptional regulator [Thermanaeromonas toyohensis]SMB97364.1 transcriptional regulator, LacI family [Thermanaeromonas toyohensis ToBE]
MVTIKDVAKAAGVAPSTVSHVLNKSAPVSPQTREKVLAAVKALGYQPSAVAQSLKLGFSKTIALIVPTISTPMYSEMIEGIEEEATNHGYNLILCRSGRDPIRELMYLKILRTNRVDGIILAAPQVNDPCLKELEKSSLPAVIIGGYPPNNGIPSIKVDNKGGTWASIEYLLSLGHRKIAFINGYSTVPDSKERLEAIKECLAHYHIPWREDYYREGDFTRHSGAALAQELMASEEPPTAIFIASDTMAIGAMQAIKNMGWSIPEDVSLIGFDDIKFCQYLDPPLTTVRQPAYEMGKAAMKALLALFSGERSEALSRIFEAKLIIRGSCAKPRSKDLGEGVGK